MRLALDEDGGSALEMLGDGECLALLEGNSIGRVAVSIGALPAIVPVRYAMWGGAIYFSAGRGTRLSAALRGAAVAFEVDHVDPLDQRGWSVLAIGEANEVEPDEVAGLPGSLPVRPWAPGAPPHLVRIRPDFLSGRRLAFSPTG